MAAASAIFGGIGAIDQPNLEGLLAYSSIAQIGFIMLPVAIAATATDPAVQTVGLAAALVYSINHGFAKALLFLATGTIEDAVGSTRFSDLGGLAEVVPVLSGAFLIGALSLVGIPPLTGFFAKLLVFDAAVRAGAPLALAVALAGAVLTIAYVTRAWGRAFWGEPGTRVQAAAVAVLAADSGGDSPGEGATMADGGHADAHDDGHGDDLAAAAGIADPVLVGCTLSLAVLVVALGIGFEPLYAATEAAAEAALNTEAYVEAVDPAVAGDALASDGGTGGEHDVAERLRDLRHGGDTR
jgi:Formate hydrogenlyase subunit 3/Multisubunit Na+/H+ antiporter, MnhD subunit